MIHVLTTSWFTPTSLFLFVNIIIGTIVLTSRFTGRKHHQQQQANPNPHHHQQIVRVPSLLERVRSFNFSPHYIYSDHQTAIGSDGPKPVAEMGSEPEMKVEEEVTVMKKSVSEKGSLGQREEDARVERGGKVIRKVFSLRGDQEVDAKADDFINRFRQQLRLQRIDSLLRCKEMLTRGSRK